jgi:ADP-ribose pyrophosphatase YjhB (NUDIX family)
LVRAPRLHRGGHRFESCTAHHTPNPGRSFRERLSLLGECWYNSIMKREYPETPIAGVGLVVVKGDKVLLVKRGKEPGRGRWGLPGGAVELGETVAQAAEREVDEECGIKIEIRDVIEVIDRIIPDDDGRIRYHYILIDLSPATSRVIRKGLQMAAEPQRQPPIYLQQTWGAE